MLEITDSSLTYRRRYLTHLEPHAIADLLLADETNPRSVAFQLAQIDQHLAALPRDTSHPDRNYDQRLLLKLRTAIQLADFVELCSMPVERRREKFDSLLSDILEQIAPARRGYRPIVFFPRHRITGNQRDSPRIPRL